MVDFLKKHAETTSGERFDPKLGENEHNNKLSKLSENGIMTSVDPTDIAE